MDMLGPFPKFQRGHISSWFTKFNKSLKIHAVPNQIADLAAKLLWINSKFGSVLQLHTDEGGNSDGKVMKVLCEFYHITKIHITLYWLCSNYQVKHHKSLFLQLIHCYFQAMMKMWDQDFQLLAGAIQSMKNRYTHFHANILMLGMEVLQPINIILCSTLQESYSLDPVGYVKHL